MTFVLYNNIFFFNFIKTKRKIMTKKIFHKNKILKSSKIKYHCRPHLGHVLIFFCRSFSLPVEGSFKSHGEAAMDSASAIE